MPTGSERFYLDTSAIAKLVLPEPEGPALTGTVGSSEAATSIVGVVEARRAVARADLGPDADSRLEDVLAALSVVAFDPMVAGRAARLRPLKLRSLDAIHLASALHLGAALSSFVTYDRRLAEAASMAGIPVLSPS